MYKQCKNCYAIYDVSEDKCPTCGAVYGTIKEKNTNVKQNVKQKDDPPLIAYIVIGGIVVFFIAIFILGASGSDTSDEQGQLERAACRSRSNTYQKCSWNVWENRCTCKLR